MLPTSIRQVVLTRRRFSTPAFNLQNIHSSPALAAPWITFLGTAFVATAIAFAPPHEFDNLDCQSYCQRYCVSGGACDE
jgi:hypothetical protein